LDKRAFALKIFLEDKMENKKIWLGILVIVLGIIVVGNLAAQTDASVNGIWVNTEGLELKLINGNYEMTVERSSAMRGTYTTNGGIIVFTPTQLHGDMLNVSLPPPVIRDHRLESKWYSFNELVLALKIPNGREALVSRFFEPQSQKYSVKGNILTLDVGTRYEDSYLKRE
jgi:hypothetical protein